MKVSRRAALVILGLGIVFLLAATFWPFILDTFVKPLAVVFWMFWRVAISIDQGFYWGFLILGILAYLTFHATARQQDFEQNPQRPDSAALEAIRYWRMAIGLNSDELDRPNILKNNLAKMLATAYTLRQPGSTFMENFERLKSRQLDIPDSISAFLFPITRFGRRRPVLQLLRSLAGAPARWLHHWSGRDVSEYYQKVAEVITFMESLMEMDHDDTDHSRTPDN
jgi:hypothetical protein